MFSRIRSGADDETVDQLGRPDEHVVEEDRGVGQDHPLRAAVADVALVPERLVLHRGDGVAAEQPGEAGDPLREDRVPLVGHRARALLARLERLHHLADLGVLEVPDLGREPLQRAAEDRDRRHQRRVPVALDDLGADRVGMEPELGKDLRLDVGPEMAVRPDRPRDLAGRDLVDRLREPAPPAVDLERPAGELQPERDRLRVDAVGPAHHQRVRLAPGAGDERRQEAVGGAEQEPAGVAELERERRVDDVAARQARDGDSGPPARPSRRPG